MSAVIDTAARRSRRQNFKFGAGSKTRTAPVAQDSGAMVEHGPTNMDEKLASLFEPDTLASAQYFDNLRRRTVLEPERRLVLAILEDAVASFQDNVSATDNKARKLFNDTEEWIMESDGDWIFSFASVCEILGLNPEYVRRGLLRWKEKKLANQIGHGAWRTTKMAG